MTGTGAMGVNATGTLIGTFVFAIMPPLIHAPRIFDVRALAMACGVGSGSMLAACTGGLIAVIPEQEEVILALAAASNILTYAAGLYAAVFVALPLTEWLYRRARPNDPANPPKGEKAWPARPICMNLLRPSPTRKRRTFPSATRW